jgi:hypothetical protein
MPKATKNIFLDPHWCATHVKQIRSKAGPRYTPELNVNLPIAQIFDGISRTEAFYTEIRENYGKLNRSIQDVFRNSQRSGINQGFSEFKKQSDILLVQLKAIKEFSKELIPWSDIGRRSRRLITASFKLIEKIETNKPQGKDEKEKQDFLIRSIRDSQKILHFFETYSKGSKARLANNPHLIILGEAGIGKTHLLCDLISARLGSVVSLKPAVLVFGEELDCRSSVISQIIQRVHLDSAIKDENQFLAKLDKAGQKAHCRSLLIVDAANEMLRLKSSKRLMLELYKNISRYPNIGLVISIRNGYEDLFINRTIKSRFEVEYHPGFKNREWAAVYSFFNEFKLPLPEIPLLAPEFLNPLFLLLFCKAFQKRSGQKKSKSIYRGHEGATYIFEHFVKSIADRLVTKYKLPKGKTKDGYVIWDTVIEKMAENMVGKNNDRLTENEAIAIVSKAYPKVNSSNFLKDLETNMLVVKVPNYDISSGKVTSFSYRFPFQKFSDHLLARYIFKQFHVSKKTPRQYFAKHTKLGKYLMRSWNRGLIGALMIECPERTRGLEFLNVASYLRDHSYNIEAFVDSIVWRKPDSFELDKKGFPEKTRKLINNLVKSDGDFYHLLNAFITISGCPEHPLNAQFLHRWLWKYSMPKRDSLWSVFLHRQHRGETSVDRLLEWAWSKHDKSYINDKSLLLLCVTLSWFLTTSNRAVRDKATKGLVCLLTNRLDLLIKLLEIFKGINDVYVSERLFAVAYGSSMRSHNDLTGLKNLAIWVYRNIFEIHDPPVHLLMRDYARGVIEVALMRKILLSIDEKRIWPPHKSAWIDNVPSEDQLKVKYYPEKETPGSKGMWRIWFSVIGGGDFDRYIIGTNSNSCSWTGRKFGEKPVDRKLLYEKFVSSLTPEQAKLWSECDPIICEDRKEQISESTVSSLHFKVAIGRKKDEEVRAALEYFKKSIGEKKTKYFEEEIMPYLDHNLNLRYNPSETFDLRIAQRWILNRVYELGWDPALHSEFDEDVDYTHNQGREARKPERIGKKYQWIAFHEFFAMVSDNFEFSGDSWSSPKTKRIYRGPWSPFERDIDPSFVLKPEDDSVFISLNKWGKKYFNYDAWGEKETNKQWIGKCQNIPSPKRIINFMDDNQTEWLLLNGFIKWEEKTPPEEDRYKLARREIWYMIKSYVVKIDHMNPILAWAKQQHFMGRWMPESHQFYEAFLGEYPDLMAYTDIRPDAGKFIDDKSSHEKIPFPMALTDEVYLNEIIRDCSLSDGCSIKMPSKYLINGMKLKQLYTDGRFYNERGELVSAPVSIWKDSVLDGVAMRKKDLIKFLADDKCAIFWTFLSEKNVHPPLYERRTDDFFRMEMSGVYYLNKSGNLCGNFVCFDRTREGSA